MAADFITDLGLPFLAHRLRRLSELFVGEYGQWLPEFGVTAPARSASTLLLLKQEGVLSVTDIAERIRFTHPLVINLLAELEKRGLTSVTRDANDRRRRLIELTPRGREEADRVEAAAEVIGEAYRTLSAEIGADLLDLVSRVDAACAETSFRDRLRAAANRSSQPTASGG
jgi:DNA-binding MarR family transcriptional regulator